MFYCGTTISRVFCFPKETLTILQLHIDEHVYQNSINYGILFLHNYYDGVHEDSWV